MTRLSFYNLSLFAKCLVLCISLACAGEALAQTSTGISKSRAAEIAQATYGGKLFGKIKATQDGGGNTVYEVRLDDGGRMVIVHVDENGKASKKR